MLREGLRAELARPHAMQTGRPLQFERDDDLSADRVIDAVRAAVLDYRGAAGLAQPRLVGSRRVVDAGMDHTGIATALVRTDCRLFLHHDDRTVRVCAHDRSWGRDDLLWRELERVVCAHG